MGTTNKPKKPKPTFENCWFFPLLSGGEEAGLNDPGIENFKKSHSLGRETIQNIGDARSKAAIANHEPALADFDLLQMPVDDLPSSKQYKQILETCLDYTNHRFKRKQDRETNGVEFFERAVDLLESKTLPVLRIRDRNTTGLAGSDDDKDRNRPWWRLIRGQGYSSREGVAGGTYGIGQRAPFAFSSLRTVIYYTRLPDGAEAFIAKAILCSFPHPDHQELTQNKGWFCRLDTTPKDPMKRTKWSGIRDPNAIPAHYRRDEIGTDLYIVGYQGGKNWKKELQRSVLRHFFAAIEQGALEVRISEGDESSLLSKETLMDTVKQEMS
jgi:hypothetical protein